MESEREVETGMQMRTRKGRGKEKIYIHDNLGEENIKTQTKELRND